MLASGAFFQQDAGVGHFGMAPQSGLDLSQLDAEATDLDLVVQAAEVFQPARRGVLVDKPAGQVAGPVENPGLTQMFKRYKPIQGQLFIVQASEALNFMHQAGMIHRDLKPSNILVSEDGQPHIVDFGLAKALLEENDKPDLTITRTGDFAGTLAFMAPEQASGDGSLVDTRTDVYALGVICYKLLTNRYPHQLSRAPHVAQRQIMEQDVCRPRVADPAIDSDLEALLLKALAKDPNDRYGSAGELANDLENYLKGEPLTARRFTLAYYLRKRMRRYRVQIAVASAALIGVYLLAVTGYPRIKDLARKEVLVTEIAEGFVDKLAPVEGMGLIPTYSASPLDPDYKIYGRRFSAYDNAVATIALVMSGHFEEAEQILDGLERFPI